MRLIKTSERLPTRTGTYFVYARTPTGELRREVKPFSATITDAQKYNDWANVEAWVEEFRPLSMEQINVVVSWLRSWEQLQDTAIPIRFAEDFI